MTIPILILAAGASRRMNGRDKLLLDVAGRPLLRHVARQAMATGNPVMVALPMNDNKRDDLLDGLRVQVIRVADADQGMAHSLRAGIGQLPKDAKALLIALADMPDITTDDYHRLINAFCADPDANIYRGATANGRAGNPVLLPLWAIDNPDIFQGDTGARDLLRKHADKVRMVPLPDDHAITDLDTPADWARWRKNQSLT